MTSQSLRKLQTILWSTHPKTEGHVVRCRLARILRDAGLAGLAVLSMASLSFGQDQPSAQNPPRQSRAAGTIQRPQLAPVMSSDDGPIVSSSRSRIQVRNAVHSRVLPSADPGVTQASGTEEIAPLPPISTPEYSEAPQPVNPPEIAARARQQIAPESDRAYRQTPTTDSGFNARMNYVLSGGVVSSSAESVGDWWQERSGHMVNRPEGQTRSQQNEQRQRGGRLARATGRMVDRVTLPDEPVPEVDFYDSSPIAVSASVVQQTAGQQQPLDGQEAAPTSRLKTDIRTIRPTLNYALKNIDRDQLPEDFDSRVDNGAYEARQSSPTVYQWAPTNFYHYPLYFEDPSLERYGHTYHPLVQPFASTGRFATQLVGLPYQMALHPVNSKQYALGYYRPGEWAPKKLYQIPFNEEATLMEVAVIAGLILIIP